MNETQFNNLLKNFINSTLVIESDFLGESTTSRIYHYTSPRGLLGIVENNAGSCLHFTKYNSLNDREERLDIVKHIQLYAKTISRKKSTEEFIKFVEDIRPSDKTSITRGNKTTSRVEFSAKECDTYLCCFSLEDDLLPMWNYYSKSKHYEGYSIGLSSEFFRSTSCWGKGYSIELQKVIYSDEEKKYILSCIFQPLENEYHKLTQEQKDHIKGFLQIYIDKFQFLFKNECFAHEKEVRAILQVPKDFDYKGSMLKKDFCESHGYIVPYIEFRDLGSAIKSVRIAPLFEKEIAIANVKEFLHEKGHKNISVKPSKVPIRF